MHHTKRCLPRKVLLANVWRVGGIVLLVTALFLLTMVFLKTTSYAMYSRMCNMTRGCLFVEPNCKEAFILYSQSDLTWSLILVSLELSLCAICAIFFLIMKRLFEERYDKYALVSALPSVPLWINFFLWLLTTTPTTPCYYANYGMIIDYYAKHFLSFYSGAVSLARGVQHARDHCLHAGPLGLI